MIPFQRSRMGSNWFIGFRWIQLKITVETELKVILKPDNKYLDYIGVKCIQMNLNGSQLRFWCFATEAIPRPDNKQMDSICANDTTLLLIFADWIIDKETVGEIMRKHCEIMKLKRIWTPEFCCCIAETSLQSLNVSVLAQVMACYGL